MDLVLPARRHLLTPAKQKAEESAAVAYEGDVLWKKFKAEETLVAMEDDLSLDEKSEDYLLWKNHTVEDTAAYQKAEKIPAAYEVDLPSDVKSSDDEDMVVEVTDTVSDSSLWADDDESDDDDKSDGGFADEDERRNTKLYFKQYIRSKGFDIENFCFIGALKPLDLEDGDSDCPVVRDCKKAVEAAIKYENVKNSRELVLKNIIKCNYVLGTRYYATFDALDNATKVTRTFQTKVSRDHFTGETMIFRFREKPDSAPEPNDA